MFIQIYLNERWKEVNHPDIIKDAYLISDHGRIYSKIKKRYLNLNVNGRGPGLGYQCVTLQGTKVRFKKMLIHILVAWHFVEGYSEKNHVVNHKDGIKINNLYTNLEWTTQRKNIIHAHKKGLNNPKLYVRRGENHQDVKYPDKMIERICQLSQDKYKPKKIYTILQKEYPDIIGNWKTMQGYINNIRMRRLRTDVSAKYTYLAPKRGNRKV
jgi:hypothetical protein